MTSKPVIYFISLARVLFSPSFKRTLILSTKHNEDIASRKPPHSSTVLPELTITGSELKSKTKLISLMNFESQADSVPFKKLPIKTLIHIYKVTCNDAKNGYCKNRLYYISNCLKCPPNVVNEYIAKRTFIYSLTFDWFKSSLDVLLEFNVPPERILRDLWVLKYHRDTIRSRLEKVKGYGIDTLYPWMVRCAEEILEKYIEISQETKNILGDDKTTLAYLAERLNTTSEDIDVMCYKTPSLKSIRVTKVKSFIDFLVNEGFTIDDIASKPRIFSASQKTVQQRLEKLRSHGLTDINLNVLCRSKKGFEKYCETIGISVNENKNYPAKEGKDNEIEATR